MRKLIAVSLLTLVSSLIYSDCLYRLMYTNLHWDMNQQQVVNALPSLILRPVDSRVPTYPRTLGVISGEPFARQRELATVLLYFDAETHLLDRVYFLFLSTNNAEPLMLLLDEEFGESGVMDNTRFDSVVTFQWESTNTVAKMDVSESDWVDVDFTPRR